MLLLCGLGLFGLANARADEVLQPTFFRENVDKQVLVSGSIVVGAVLLDANAVIAPGELYVYLKERQTNPISLIIASADLRYEAAAGYRLSTPTTGWVRLAVPSREEGMFTRATLATLAVRALDESRNLYLPLRWGRPTTAASTLRLYVNGERSQVFLMRPAGTGPRYCSNVVPGSAVRFDAICDVPLAEIRNGKIAVFRQRGNSVLPAVSVSIALPD